MVDDRPATIVAVRTRDHCHPGFEHQFFGAVLSSFVVAAAQAGYEVIALGHLPRGPEYATRAARHAAAGVLVLGDGHDAEIDGLLGVGIPVVGVDFGRGRSGVTAVTSANGDGMRRVVEHLRLLGHERIAYLGAARETLAGVDRFAGFCAALVDQRLEFRRDWLLPAGFTFDDGYRATHELLRRAADPLPTALAACSDQAALGAARALGECGLQVGGDVSLTGFDDSDAATRTVPPLTTVKQDPAALGRMAASALLARLTSNVPTDAVYIAPIELVTRASTAPPPRWFASPE
jgi:DNA-binding LacI/PurR family transcriptional regulator